PACGGCPRTPTARPHTGPEPPRRAVRRRSGRSVSGAAGRRTDGSRLERAHALPGPRRSPPAASARWPQPPAPPDLRQGQPAPGRSSPLRRSPARAPPPNRRFPAGRRLAAQDVGGGSASRSGAASYQDLPLELLEAPSHRLGGDMRLGTLATIPAHFLCELRIRDELS